MYVERAQRLTPAPPAGHCTAPALTPLVAMLDQADASDASSPPGLPPPPPSPGPAEGASAARPAAPAAPLRDLIPRHSAVVRSGLYPALAARRMSLVRWDRLRSRTR